MNKKPVCPVRMRGLSSAVMLSVATMLIDSDAAAQAAPAVNAVPADADADVIKQFAQATQLPAPTVTTTAAGAEIT